MSEIQQITSKQAWQKLLDDEKALLVDVRTETEWRTVGIPDLAQAGRPARFVSWTDENGIANPYFADQVTDGVDADTPILLLCRSGVRSQAAAEMLEAAGYTQAHNITGGFEFPQEPGNGWKFVLPATEYHDNL